MARYSQLYADAETQIANLKRRNSELERELSCFRDFVRSGHLKEFGNWMLRRCGIEPEPEQIDFVPMGA